MEPVLRSTVFGSNFGFVVKCVRRFLLSNTRPNVLAVHDRNSHCGSKTPKKPCPPRSQKRAGSEKSKKTKKSVKRGKMSSPCRPSSCCGHCNSSAKCTNPPKVLSKAGSSRCSPQQKPVHPLESPCGPPQPAKLPPIMEPPCPCPKMPQFGDPCEDSKPQAALWRNLVRFIAFPAVIFGSLIIMPMARDEYNTPRPPYRPFTYMYIRNVKFPWGDGNHTLFHNPYKNAVPPDGYEVPDPYAIPVETKYKKKRKRENY